MDAPKLPILHRLRALLEVMSAVRAREDLPSLLSEISRVASESLGYRTVVINLYRPAWDDFEVATVYGSDAARELLLGDARSHETWAPLLDERFLRRGAYLVPHGEYDWAADAARSFIPELARTDDPGAWHPEDALFAPMEHSDGHLLGILSVDEPVSGRVPSDVELDILVAVAAHAALAVETAQNATEIVRHRFALERLLEVSSRLTETESTDAMLDAVCGGIRDALGFREVSVELLNRESGYFEVRAGAGSSLAAAYERAPVGLEAIEPLLAPELEVEGCYLVDAHEAAARLPGVPIAYASVLNGRGPHGWNHHWLFVPLFDRSGDLRGVIWADDPEDRMIPSRERLQALRTFANQAAAALESAAQVSELRDASERFRMAALASGSAVYEWDYATLETRWTESFTRIFGYELDHETASYSWWLERVHPDDRDGVAPLAETAEERPSYDHRYRFLAADGTWRDVLERGLTFATDNGLQAIGAVIDVTELRMLEEQLRQSQKLEAIGRLAGGVAHDFNNLLTAITGYGELALARVKEGADPRREIQETLRSAERAASLTRQLLAFSRKQVLEPRVLDLNRVVADLERLLSRLIGEDVVLATRLEPGLGRIEADPGQVEQIVINLAVNARDAMPEGGTIVLETATVRVDDDHGELAPGPYVRLAVSDTGTGMDEDTRLRIFEPFFTTKEQGRGTGLGLATVYGIVKQSGGAIEVRTEPGRGTTFDVYLPSVLAAVEDEPGTVSPPERPPAATILLVEDEPAVRTLVCEILEERGYRVLAATQPVEALEIAEGHEGQIDLLLTDIVMPRMSGRELAQRFSLVHPESRLLYMSGYTDGAILSHGVLAEGTRFLQKPFTMDGLVAKISEVLQSMPATA